VFCNESSSGWEQKGGNVIGIKYNGCESEPDSTLADGNTLAVQVGAYNGFSQRTRWYRGNSWQIIITLRAQQSGHDTRGLDKWSWTNFH